MVFFPYPHRIDEYYFSTLNQPLLSIAFLPSAVITQTMSPIYRRKIEPMLPFDRKVFSFSLLCINAGTIIRLFYSIMTLLSGCAVLNNLESYFLLISKSQNYFISIVMIHRSVLKFILVMNLYNFVHAVKMKFSKCVNRLLSRLEFFSLTH